ncbi:MerR family transcriptional regulator [Paenibacillus humicola]|uniref:MerR family transcriptional regulator n=1 Tax=Paenibacillus humicola TaxID=3110540 RepID=UPI00237B6C02|nr:MerR family transcriptional regulator [Paenibacillus humicola]
MEPTTYTIADIASRTGLSYDTIRYYEKIGLTPPAKRRDNGQRTYDSIDLERFVFVTTLKRTHMPLKEIERYMAFAGDRNFEKSYEVLHEHKLRIVAQMAEMNAALEMMNYKLDYYENMVSRMKNLSVREPDSADETRQSPDFVGSDRPAR